ncbi:uncharacterized protein LOC115383937 isoform X1 [Salarias fasciatus]|uniref:uncharacterized protein LOC115383937 isoform X1 n=1 Tax=Salarias fasciatus TaxID=181472 RepID=UPI001176A7F7|nr:uncharacterized protein LOC115383937 isoform X1 [Salarias fasciatus]XP_029942017.1 uncharacterized protein LOC115383937 isoform X1 [Salarias fasciatus]
MGNVMGCAIRGAGVRLHGCRHSRCLVLHRGLRRRHEESRGQSHGRLMVGAVSAVVGTIMCDIVNSIVSSCCGQHRVRRRVRLHGCRHRRCLVQHRGRRRQRDEPHGQLHGRRRGHHRGHHRGPHRGLIVGIIVAGAVRSIMGGVVSSITGVAVYVVVFSVIVVGIMLSIMYFVSTLGSRSFQELSNCKSCEETCHYPCTQARKVRSVV